MVILPAGSPVSARDYRSSVSSVIHFHCSGKSPDGSKRLLFHIHGGHCAPGNTRSFRNYFIALTPRSLPRHSFIAEVCKELRGLHGVDFVPTRSVNCGILDAQVRAILNFVRSILFATGGLRSHSRHISRTIKANKWSATAKKAENHRV